MPTQRNGSDRLRLADLVVPSTKNDPSGRPAADLIVGGFKSVSGLKTETE
jgi:hypothetical protein